MLFTKPKVIITCLAAACALSASAWNDMYIVGPGVVTGYDLGNAAAMNKTSENPEVFEAVMYLDNKDGRSFRMQPDKDWVQANYYGPAVSGEQLTNNTQVTVSRGNDSYYTVATPGVYLIKLETTAMKITIFQMDEIFIIGDGTNAGWNADNAISFSRNGNEYTAEIDFKPGAFKFGFDKPHCFDNRWMFFKDWRGAFKTSLDDTNWTVGYRDSKENDGNDVDPGRYRVTVNTADKSVKYTRLMQSVSLDGGAVLKGWDKNGAINLTKDGDVFKAKHVYFTSGSVYKPVVDGRYYGSDTWRTPNHPTTAMYICATPRMAATCMSTPTVSVRWRSAPLPAATAPFTSAYPLPRAYGSTVSATMSSIQRQTDTSTTSSHGLTVTAATR